MTRDDCAPSEVQVTTQTVAAAQAIAQLARDLHQEADPGDVLDRVVTTATTVLGGVEHAAITVVRRDRQFVTAAASDPLTQRVDAIQYETGQGPCLDVLRHEHTFHARDLSTESRWPQFTRRTVAETSVRAMMSFQLLSNADTLGALNFYSTRAGAFDDDDLQSLCAVFATHAALALSRALEHDQFLGMRAGVDAARDINTAVGITMHSKRLSQTEAYNQLRAQARTTRRSLAELCRDIVAAAEADRPGTH